MHISVIICTHNPREDYLRRTLEALERQTLPKDQWELLLIDNASKELLAGKWDLSWHPHGRHVLESDLGLTPARLRGIEEAVGELLIFIDDDNVIDLNYLQQALQISSRMPNLGCFGAGRIEPEFEEEPEDALRPYTGMLALRTVSEPYWSNVPDDSWVPWGAGLCVTRGVSKQYFNAVNQSKTQMLLGRKGGMLNSGEDDEFSWAACSMGFGRGIFPELRVLHLIDRRRVQREYLLRIAEGHAFSHEILKAIHGRRLDETQQGPSALTVLQSLLACSPSAFFHEGLRWWTSLRWTPLERAFVEAREQGLSRARTLLQGS
jgi:glycosyltransferase involved in cell wall biosynthesis